MSNKALLEAVKVVMPEMGYIPLSGFDKKGITPIGWSKFCGNEKLNHAEALAMSLDLNKQAEVWAKHGWNVGFSFGTGGTPLVTSVVLYQWDKSTGWKMVGLANRINGDLIPTIQLAALLATAAALEAEKG